MLPRFVKETHPRRGDGGHGGSSRGRRWAFTTTLKPSRSVLQIKPHKPEVTHWKSHAMGGREITCFGDDRLLLRMNDSVLNEHPVGYRLSARHSLICYLISFLRTKTAVEVEMFITALHTGGTLRVRPRALWRVRYPSE